MIKKILSFIISVLLIFSFLPTQNAYVKASTKSYKLNVVFDDSLCDVKIVADLDNSNINNGDYVEGGRYWIVIYNVIDGYRLEKALVNGKNSRNIHINHEYRLRDELYDSYPDDLEYAYVYVVLDSDTTIELELKQSPDPLPVISDAEGVAWNYVIKNSNNHDIYSLSNTIDNQVLFTDYQNRLYTNAVFTDGQTYPDYYFNCYWEYSTDGENWIQLTTWGNRNDFWAAWPEHTTDFTDQPFDFMNSQNYYLRAHLFGREEYSTGEAYSEIITVSSISLEPNFTDLIDDNSWQIASTQTIGPIPPLSQTVVNEISQEIKIRIDGNLIKTQQPAISKNGRTLVPLRAVCENLNMDVEWNGSTQSIHLTEKLTGTKISLTIGNKTASVNGEKIDLDEPPYLHPQQDGSSVTMVPVRFVAENVDALVSWEDNTKTVNIKTPDKLFIVKSTNKGTKTTNYLGGFSNGNGSYYCDATKALKAFGSSSNTVSSINPLDGYLSIFHPTVGGITADYNLTNLKEWDWSYVPLSSNATGINGIAMTILNGKPYVNINDVAKAEGAVINNRVIDDTISSQISKNSVKKSISVGPIDSECTKNKAAYLISWETDIPTYNCDIKVEPEKNKYNMIYRTPIMHEPNNTFQNATVYFTYPEGKLEDVWMIAYITLDGQTYERHFLVEFKTNMINQLNAETQRVSDEFNTIYEAIQQKLIDKRKQLYIDTFSNAFNILPQKTSSENEIQIINLFMGEKYLEYLVKEKKYNLNTIDEKKIEDAIMNGIYDTFAETGEYIFMGYSIRITSQMGMWNQRTFVVNVNNGNSYTLTPKVDTVVSRINSYSKELQGMFDIAVEECISETHAAVGDIYGLDNLNKILLAWVDKSLWGERVNNDFIDAALSGLTKGYNDKSLLEEQKQFFNGNSHDDLNKLYTEIKNSIKDISDAKTNLDTEDCIDALNTLEGLTDLFGGWEVILQ